MKKFFTNIPLQGKEGLSACVYTPVGNDKLRMDGETHFPIIPTLRGYVCAGEEFRLIAVVADNDDCRRNLDALKEELRAACVATGAVCPRGVETVTVSDDQRVAAHVSTFQQLIDFTDDDDELFACITFGTKPASIALMMAVQYAYRIKQNASISCVVYGQIDRSTTPNVHYIYDMTALVQLDEIVRVLADRGVVNPKETIDRILSL